MSLEPRDAGDAAQLLACGLQPRLRPAADGGYAQLLERYQTDVAFRDVVEHVAEGLGLVILDVGMTQGLVLGPAPDSVFALNLGDYRQNLSVSARLVHGLIHVGIATYCFPTAAALVDDAVQVVDVNAIESFLRDACLRLREQHGDADPDSDQPETEQAWRAYLRRQPARETADGRIGISTTTGMIKYACERLVDAGCATRVSDDNGGTYRMLGRYRVHVRELASTEAYRQLSEATSTVRSS